MVAPVNVFAFSGNNSFVTSNFVFCFFPKHKQLVLVKNSRGISPMRIALKRALAVQWYAFGYIVLVTRLELARNKTACYLVTSCRCASANSATPEIQFKELKNKTT